MKTLKKYSARLVVAVALLLGITLPAKSQVSLDAYYNVDWQFNIPINKFADKASGWGMNFDAGWYITPDIAIGAFMNYHTNSEYVGRSVVNVSPQTAIFTDQQRSLYQLPFGVTALYRIIESDWQPYVAMKLGAEYAYVSSYYNIYKSAVAMDKYCPAYPTYIQRSFDQQMEVTDKEIEEMFVKFISSPEVAQVAELIKSRLGRDLEDYVAKRFTEKTGKKVRRENGIIVNPDYPFAHANVDRLIVGEDAGLECKTTSVLNLKKFKNGEYPETYYVQCVHYLLVTGAKKWYLAVLVLGVGFYHFEIERDEAEIAALAKSEADFWKLVESKTSPVADGAESTSETLSTIYPESNDDSVSLLAYERDLEQYIAITKQIKELEALKDEAANRVKAFMGESGKGESAGYKVSWTSSERKTFDTNKFAADHKDIDLSEYYKSSNYRTFKVTERG